MTHVDDLPFGDRVDNAIQCYFDRTRDYIDTPYPEKNFTDGVIIGLQSCRSSPYGVVVGLKSLKLILRHYPSEPVSDIIRLLIKDLSRCLKNPYPPRQPFPEMPDYILSGNRLDVMEWKCTDILESILKLLTRRNMPVPVRRVGKTTLQFEFKTVKELIATRQEVGLLIDKIGYETVWEERGYTAMMNISIPERGI